MRGKDRGQGEGDRREMAGKGMREEQDGRGGKGGVR